MNFQKISAPQFVGVKRKPDRKDHVWATYAGEKPAGMYHKCVLCGALTKSPPQYPTPDDWLPELGYESLTTTERALCPRD